MVGGAWRELAHGSNPAKQFLEFLELSAQIAVKLREQRRSK